MGIDHRVRLGASVDQTLAALQAMTEAHGFATATNIMMKGITPRQDHPVLSVMREALVRETGREPRQGITGGGTIARRLSDPHDEEQLSIGFGPLPEDHPETEHQPNEYIAASAVESGLQVYQDTLHALAAVGSGFIAVRLR